MFDKELIDLIEKIGYINKNGKRVYGAAAVAYFTYYMHRTFSEVNRNHVITGKRFIEKLMLIN